MLNLKRGFIAFVLLLAIVALAVPGTVRAQDGATTAAQPAPTGSTRDYVLGIGDKLRITVFNEPTLSGDFEISSTGTIAMPLISEVQAANRTVVQVQAAITQKLSDGYMKSPHVNLEVLNYRPFFIIGEVMKPGSYNFVNGMTVVNAVAMASGYTYRADKDEITLKHGGMNGKEEKVNEMTPVQPGDVINVPERFF
jgi:protein involved in polysaccharide export with SLBB domain